jgi:hypothetical protein
MSHGPARLILITRKRTLELNCNVKVIQSIGYKRKSHQLSLLQVLPSSAVVSSHTFQLLFVIFALESVFVYFHVQHPFSYVHHVLLGCIAA